MRGGEREETAEWMRCAVARASAGGTTERMRSAEETRAVSVGRSPTPAERARVWVSSLRPVMFVTTV